MIKIRGSTLRKLGAFALGLTAVSAAVMGTASTTPAQATSGTLSALPFDSTVAPAASFTVAIRQSAAVATSGAQADVTFNKNVLQVVGLSRGSAYPADAGGGFLCSPSCGTLVAGVSPETIAQAIASANASGVLQNASVYYGTPGGEPSVPAGDQEALLVTMQAVGAAGTSSALTLSNVAMLDATGVSLTVTAVSGSVSIATEQSHLAAVPSVTTLVPASGTVVFRIDQTASVATSGAGAGMMFDPARWQVTSLVRGAAYPADAGGGFLCSPACGTLVAGVAPQTVAQAIAEANKTGFLRGASVYYGTPGGEPSVPAGTQDALHVTMQAVIAGNPQGALRLVNPEMVTSTGDPLLAGAGLRVQSVGGIAESPNLAPLSAGVGEDGGMDTGSTLAVAAPVLGLIAGGLWLARGRRRAARTR